MIQEAQGSAGRRYTGTHDRLRVACRLHELPAGKLALAAGFPL